MDERFVLSLALLSLAVSPIQSFPSGAPSQACSDLRPGPPHGGVPQTTPSPYGQDVDMFEDLASNDEFTVPVTYSYTPGRTYNLVLRVNPTHLDADPSLAFRGFFIQARLVADDSNVGGFLDSLAGQEYRLSSCNTSTIGATHINNNPKTSVVVRWTAPGVDTGSIRFRYTFVQTQMVFWQDLSSPDIMNRRCDIATGPYYDSVSGNCVFSCPRGFQGVYATGTCDPVPANFMAASTADVYTARLESSVADMSVIINFTIVANNAQFGGGGVSTIILSAVGTRESEELFRLSDGSVSRSYTSGELQRDGMTTFVSDSIIVRNSPTTPTPLTPDVYDIAIGGVVVGVGSNGSVLLLHAPSTGLIEVVESSNPCTASTGNPCQNGGTCTQDGASFSCTCPPAYTGQVCEVLFDPCALGMCRNGATCVNVNSTVYECQCPPDFTDMNCDVAIDHCDDPSVNCNNGTCVDGVGFFTCECSSGYTGGACDIDINECATANCINGICIDLVGRHECDCFLGWTGESCETNIDFCETSDPTDANGPCDDIGSSSCTDGNSTFTCTCVIGFTSADCSVDIDECESVPCANNGTCISGFFGIFDCTCPDEYTGLTCGTNLFPCTQSPCFGDSTCSDLSGGNFECLCPNGFSGDLCETDIDVCNISSCENGGTCTDGVGLDFSCLCPPGYTGDTCQLELPQCMLNTCQNGGTCMEGEGLSFSCDCPDGFTGGACEIDVDFCTNETCLNSGTCEEGRGTETTCVCAVGFYGQTCQIFIHPCDICLNGGQCEGVGTSASCSCPAGFTGVNCEVDMSFCTDGVCMNNGRCVEGTGEMISCICMPGYGGERCQDEDDIGISLIFGIGIASLIISASAVVILVAVLLVLLYVLRRRGKATDEQVNIELSTVVSRKQDIS